MLAAVSVVSITVAVEGDVAASICTRSKSNPTGVPMPAAAISLLSVFGKPA